MSSFRTWLEVYLNPLYYDLKTPEGKAEYEREKAELTQQIAQRQARKELHRTPQKMPFLLTCWRGCTQESLQMMTTQETSEYVVLDPRKSRSRALWFAHQFQQGGQEYAHDHGEIVITYPVKCWAYSDVVQYSDGTTVKEPSREMSDKVEMFSECPFGIFGDKVLELPTGWTFSEHGEKHVLREEPLMVPRTMIKSGLAADAI